MVKCMKLSKEELQKAVGYVAYMQMASYFDVKPECINKNMEKKLYILYKLMPTKQQYEVEKLCDKYIQKMLQSIPEEILSMRSECIFQNCHLACGEGAVKIMFSTWKYDFYILAYYNNNQYLEFDSFCQVMVEE